MSASLYLRHFSLATPPFPLTPDGDAVYVAGSRKAIVDALLHVLRDDRGIVKVVGDAGTGKTTLCRHLARTLRDRFAPIYTCDPSLGGDQTVFALADALGVAVDRARPADAAAALRACIAERARSGRPVLLLVDEAHALPPETLEQMRLLAQGDHGAETMRIALFGPDELDHGLAVPSMDALRTRIAHSLRLNRLKLADIGEYLSFRLAAAGWSGGPVFTPNAVRAIARLSGGIPRRINVLADKAMLSAAIDRRLQVRSKDVATAASEIRLARRGSTQPPWVMAAGGFAAGVACSLLAGVLWWQSGAPAPRDAAAAATPAATGVVDRAAAPGVAAAAPSATPPVPPVAARIDPTDPGAMALPLDPTGTVAVPRFAQDVTADRPAAR